MNTHDSESSPSDIQGRNLEIGRCWRRSFSKQGQHSASELTKDVHFSSVPFFNIGSDFGEPDDTKVEDRRTPLEIVCGSLCFRSMLNTSLSQDTPVLCQEEDEPSTVGGAFLPRSAR